MEEKEKLGRDAMPYITSGIALMRSPFVLQTVAWCPNFLDVGDKKGIQNRLGLHQLQPTSSPLRREIEPQVVIWDN